MNGPLAGFSDTTGSNPAPYFGQCVTSSGTDPSATQPGGPSSGANLWLDVQVTNFPPDGYTGSYRLWPNMHDSDFATQGDASVNYVIGTEIIVSQASTVNAVWYYSPSGTAQLATSADIWSVRTGASVASNSSPSWKTWGGGAASAGGGWCYTALPVTLPAGDYRVSVYNGAGSPDSWGAKRLGYWQAWNQAPDGTYQHDPPAPAGITAGPLYAPSTPQASAAVDYNTSAIEPGQSVFAVGPPNAYPDLYVGQPSNLFQNYWVDLEVTPVQGAYSPRLIGQAPNRASTY